MGFGSGAWGGGPGVAGAAVDSPAVAINAPQGTSLGRTTALQIDITDPDGFSSIVLSMLMPGLGNEEMIHNGTKFSPRYLGVINQRTNITDGFRYDILRDGGWASRLGSTLTLIIAVVDSTGLTTKQEIPFSLSTI